MNKIRVEKLNVYGQVCPSTLLLALREVNRLQDELHRGKCSLTFVPTTVLRPPPSLMRCAIWASTPRFAKKKMAI